ncbi:DUF6466 family protein [uncultured Bifidobacterium sp.]|uniref:DUF6466 family protein n=1 Tax=uncultured Bifidobacterium sp. TaxID=165187 RepID=UPI0026088CDD|nr:DUF6466 family protein [uncultured Bifidobacterium sp.]
MRRKFQQGARGGRHLRVRLILAGLALVAALAGAWGLINVRAIAIYNEGTHTLSANVRQAQNPQADPASIKALQDQAEHLFAQVERPGLLILPQTRQAAQANRAANAALTSSTERLFKKQKADKARDGQNGSSKGSSSGLTERQEAEVEDLLKRSQQQSEPSASPTPTGKASDNKGQGRNVKPW